MALPLKIQAELRVGGRSETVAEQNLKHTEKTKGREEEVTC